MLPGHGGGPAAVALVTFVTVAVAAVPAGVGARGAVPGRVRVTVRGGVVAVVVVVAGRVPAAAAVLMVVAAGAPFNGGKMSK